MARCPGSVLILLPLLVGCSADEVGDPWPVDSSCISLQVLEPGICSIQRSGLVLHRVDSDLVASRLRDDGTLEQLMVLGEDVNCYIDAFEYDAERGKLWWFESSAFEDPAPGRLHQFDLATGSEDWERDLVFEGHPLRSSASLLVHEGTLYLGGSVPSDDPFGLDRGDALLVRFDAAGEPVWTWIGSLHLERATNLIGTNAGISFLGREERLGYIASTGATVDAQTGELLWSMPLVPLETGLLDGVGDSLVWLSGNGRRDSWSPDPAQTDVRAITPLGEQQWVVDTFDWNLILATFGQAIVGDEVVHATAGVEGDYQTSKIRATRRRMTDGSLICASELPLEPFAWDKTAPTLRLHQTPKHVILATDVETQDGYEVVYLLLTLGE